MHRRHFHSVAFGSLALARTRLFAATGDAANIDSVLKSGMARRNIPAAVGMVADKSKVLYEGAFGTRDSSGVPVRMDSIFRIASMTKPITTVAALQLVEQGKVQLDEPVAKHLPQLAGLEVLDGFDSGTGKPVLRPAKTQVTLRQLLTHTSGFCYDIWDGEASRYAAATKGQPATDKPSPLIFEPGTRWQYGQGIDWAGRLVEAVSGVNLEDYFQSNILKPLQMRDTSFILPESKFERLVSGYSRQADGTLKQDPRKLPVPPKTFNGGGGLYSTAADYVRFLQAMLGKAPAILSANTIESMKINQIGEATAGKMKSYKPDYSSDVDIQPGFAEKWGLGFLINTTPYSGGRSAGSLAWAGIQNTFFWIDPKRSLCAVLLMQFLPFVDKEAVGLLGDFERAVYAAY